MAKKTRRTNMDRVKAHGLKGYSSGDAKSIRKLASGLDGLQKWVDNYGKGAPTGPVKSVVRSIRQMEKKLPRVKGKKR